MEKNKKNKIISQEKIKSQISKFEKKHPDIAEAMKVFDMSMSHYETSIKSLEQTKISITHSTKVQ